MSSPDTSSTSTEEPRPLPEPSEPIEAGDLAGAIDALLLAVDVPVDSVQRAAAIENARYCAEWWHAQQASVMEQLRQGHHVSQVG